MLQLQQMHELRERRRQHQILRSLHVLPPSSSSPSVGLEDEQTEEEGLEGSEPGKQIKTGPATSAEERQQVPVMGEAESQGEGKATAGPRGGGEQSIEGKESIRKNGPAQSIPVDMLVNVGCNTYLRARG